MTRLLALLSLLGLAACAPEFVERLPADGTRDEPLAGPFGVATLESYVLARGTTPVEVEVAVPLASDRTFLPGPRPTVLFVQGGLVDPVRYRWLAVALASRGQLVISTRHAGDLAIFSPDESWRALKAVRRGDGPFSRLEGVGVAGESLVVMGHSLGGVVSVGLLHAHPEVDAAVLLASRPAGYHLPEDQAGRPVLSLAGANDGSAEPASVREGFDLLAAPRTLAFVDGMNHFAWTDDPTARNLAGDGEQTRPVADTRVDAVSYLRAWLAEHLDDAAPVPAPDGVTVEVDE